MDIVPGKKQPGPLCCACGKKCTSQSGTTLHKAICKTHKHIAYEKAVAFCLIKAKILIAKLIDARGVHCFLETEWINRRLCLVGKDPRARKPDVD